jgi:glycerol-3-phosphate acyltransferase PlsY
MPGALAALGALVAGYLIGSLPVGLIAGRLTRGIDLREEGSGRTGATNALRTLGPRAAVVVLVLDVGKGALAVGTGLALGNGADPALAAWLPSVGGLAAVIGHMRSVFIGFRGGRGVAPSAGALLLLSPLTLAVLLPVMAGVVWRTRYVSLGSVIAAATAIPVTAAVAWLGAVGWPAAAFAATAGALVILAHRDNLDRLRAGTERRLGQPAGSGP